MAEEGESTGDKTEAATQRHLDQARQAGNVPISREASAFASFAAATLVLLYYVPGAIASALPPLRALLARAGDGRLAKAGLSIAIADAAWVVLPLLAAAAVAGAIAVLAQSRLLVNFGALEPKLSRVSPIEGIKRIFGSRGLMEAAKVLGRLAVLGLALWASLSSAVPALLLMPLQDARGLPFVVLDDVSRALLTGLWVKAALAALDYGWVLFKYARDLRMTKMDIRDEFKETEGNPQTKARVRRIRFIRSRQRMMRAVPTATVVVTNPTHYAVALAYDRSANPAPRVVAKGVDDVAARIRDVAREHRVPIVANPPLARALFGVKLGTEIPAEHYKAVAQIIAYVWRLKAAAGR